MSKIYSINNASDSYETIEIYHKEDIRRKSESQRKPEEKRNSHYSKKPLYCQGFFDIMHLVHIYRQEV